MRFKTELKNIRTFSKFTAALSSLEKIAWVRLDDETARFTVIPDTGSQVWSVIPMDFIFDGYHIQSAEKDNTINLELPLALLQRALRSASNSTSASLRLTKKDGVPVLSMTITTTTSTSGAGGRNAAYAGLENDPFDDDEGFMPENLTSLRHEREKIITQNIPVRVLHPETVETIMQPTVRETDVHIMLPPLLQLKAISDRFTKLAMASGSSRTGPKLELSANMFGSLKLRIATESVNVSTTWSGLQNPELDQSQFDMPLEEHPSVAFTAGGENKWATVRVDGKDWSKVLSVGRLEGRVVAAFVDDHALILHVYVPQYEDAQAEEAILTYYVGSFSQ
ncbi:Hus1-like protein [Colletotrichum karsti]|uniref:Checkpoint protein n=1 Tax=Colletotrichum karsti TaxID=1095194 RepID=A0A9P6ICR1_9PEZI|nr:Hus1-like protein [Colletotrichum karsti]KAF9881007.1 Hus1-like protein [Colletotrichum karsti]